MGLGLGCSMAVEFILFFKAILYFFIYILYFLLILPSASDLRGRSESELGGRHLLLCAMCQTIVAHYSACDLGVLD